MTNHPLDQHILDLLKKNGEMFSRDIYATKPEVSVNTIRGRIAKLKDQNKVEKVKNGLYKLASPSETQTSPNETLKHATNALRSAEANKQTIDTLMNLYDEVLKHYTAWVGNNVGGDTDFEKQLLFIENFKWLTAIGDKLMKRWSLEHVGYDTNTRQAQEDAKAKTAEREKAALEEAPLEEQVSVIGSFDLETKQLIDNFPTLESISKEEEEEIKV